MENEHNTKKCSECGEFHPEDQVKEVCEHLLFCKPCYVKLFGDLDYEFVTDSDEFFSEVGRGNFIEDFYFYVKGRRKDVERIVEILSNKPQFEKSPGKCFVNLEYRYYAANIFKERHDPIPWTSEYMTYREHAHRSLKISLDGYRDQVKSMNDTIIGNLGEPYKVKGLSLKQRLRGYRHLTERGRLDYLKNVGKTISDYLIYFGKCFSTFFPGIGEGVFYREIRKCGGSRKGSLAMSSIFGCSKIPLFIFPCEETLALYTGISVVGSIGIALYSTDNQSKKLMIKNEVIKNER